MAEFEAEELKNKIYERLKKSGWADPLKGFLLSSDMTKLLKALHKESEDGKRWTPKLGQVFRAFEECHYDKLKVVVILQDPYPHINNGINVADGIAMSCGNTMKLQPSLMYVHREIKETVYPDKDWIAPINLDVWAKQGVLLMNIALTTTVGRTGTHYILWRPFITYVLDHLSWNNGGLIYCYLGLKAKEFSRVTNDNCHKLYAVHPAAAAHNNFEKWDSKGLFPKINQLLKKDGKSEIVW